MLDPRNQDLLAGLPRGYFGAVLADPPWKYVTYSERGQRRSASRHYKVMMFEEIATLPVRDLSARDSWLFLWVPGPHLPFGLQLIERWGFRYSGKAFAWAKQNPSGVGWHMGTGFTTRKNTEDCLLGRRGRPPIKAHDVRELIVSPRRKHSQKPDEQYERIERLVDGPYVELFARQRRPGWVAWGDEVDKFESEYDAQDNFAKSLRKATARFVSALLRAVDRGFRKDLPQPPRAAGPVRSNPAHCMGRARRIRHSFTQCGWRSPLEAKICKAIGTVTDVPDPHLPGPGLRARAESRTRPPHRRSARSEERRVGKASKSAMATH